jgi:hypothetical protein
MANAPLVGWDAQSSRSDLGCSKTEIFLRRGLDWPNQIDPVHEFPFCAHAELQRIFFPCGKDVEMEADRMSRIEKQ